MEYSLLQAKIANLEKASQTLINLFSSTTTLYLDDFSNFNQKIHTMIIELYSYRGSTVEQEASLCIAMLMGYSVCMYANPEDEIKKQVLLERSRTVMEEHLPLSLKHQLLALSNKL